jgi:hypothetical protein
MIDPKLLNPAHWNAGLDSATFRVAEVMRLFSKDSVGIRITVLYSLLATEIVLRTLMATSRLALVLTVVFFACTAGLG